MIRVLPPRIVNQIAAGEVVERPFSVVKELVENSLDAGAQRIHVEVSDGGTESIRVTDDGAGFTGQDLELAFVSHATSKLKELSDLDHIASMGFRGEALAAIGAVSRAQIQSRRHDAEAGSEVHCAGGKITSLRPCGTPPGTAITVRDLFYNTPARRRFLKSARAERSRCQELLMRLSLSRLDVDFTFVADGKTVLRLPAGDSLQDRIGRTFGRQVARGLHAVSHQLEKYRVEGVVGDPDLARRDSTLELLYINGRSAKDRGATFAIRQAYRAWLMHGRFPVYFLTLWLPPEEVDVNVHPTKSEVRFTRPRLACGILHDAVQRGLAARGTTTTTSAPGLAVGGAVGGELPRARSGLPDLPKDLFARDVPAPPPGTPPAAGTPVVRERGTADTPNPFVDLRSGRFLQVLDLYLVFEGTDGLVVVDQHALHERVLYERFKHRDEGQAIKVQGLLVPEVCELSPSDKAWLLDGREALAREGLLFEDFGGNAVAVQGIPAVLDHADPRRLLESFLAGDGDRPTTREAVVERFHSMACRRAVMSGDALTDEEIRALLAEAQGLEHPHNCPHGRPTVLTFTAGELERFFRRKV
ncbi:MAG: DNA mismatch repair endonuclease MutL [Planctomycetota bacterium]|jgi:DNA mismatch repair protein MutL